MDESRGYLQERLALFLQIVFWIYVAMLLGFVVLSLLVPAIELGVGTAIAVVVLGALWRALSRLTFSTRMLHIIEATAAGLNGLQLASTAILSPDLRITGPAAIIYAYWWVFSRALLVPSSGRWTAIVSGIVLAPIAGAAVVLAATTKQEVPPVVYVLGGVIWCAAAIIIASTGSRILYGLRRQVRKAQQLGQYTLDRKIGEGGMGAVYLAHHALLRRPTAIKLLRPERVGADAVSRFEREVQHMSRLTHANSVAVFDYGRSPDGVFYYAMEYLGGGLDLEQLVRRYGALPAGRVVHVMMQVCRALHEAHNRGIVHRDIKPANIILCERGDEPDVAKVVDYGLVKEIEHETGTSTQVILGTPAYLAPEVVTDPGHISPAIDIYGLGAVGYYLLTGKRVFEGKTAVDVCIQHVSAKPVSPATLVDMPAVLDALILRCLSKQPADRPASAAALASELRALDVPAWSDADAHAWWKAHRDGAAAPDPSTSTVTLAIDLDRRVTSEPRAGDSTVSVSLQRS